MADLLNYHSLVRSRNPPPLTIAPGELSNEPLSLDFWRWVLNQPCIDRLHKNVLITILRRGNDYHEAESARRLFIRRIASTWKIPLTSRGLTYRGRAPRGSINRFLTWIRPWFSQTPPIPELAIQSKRQYYWIIAFSIHSPQTKLHTTTTAGRKALNAGLKHIHRYRVRYATTHTAAPQTNPKPWDYRETVAPTIADICRLHALAMNGAHWAGQLRPVDFHVRAGSIATSDPASLRQELAWMLAAYRHDSQNSDPTARAIAITHAQISLQIIHPFPDGNGRLGRLWLRQQTRCLTGREVDVAKSIFKQSIINSINQNSIHPLLAQIHPPSALIIAPNDQALIPRNPVFRSHT